MLLMQCCHCLTLHSIFKYIYTLMIHILENRKNTKLPCTSCSKVILNYTHILSIMKLVRIQKCMAVHIRVTWSQLMLLLHILFCNSKNLYVYMFKRSKTFNTTNGSVSLTGSVDNMVLFLLLDNNQICAVFRNAHEQLISGVGTKDNLKVCGFKALS